jgi:polyhydroxyalkanoate synthesis regulator phasin
MYSGKREPYIEHSSPLLEELIATGALTEEEIRKTVIEALVQARRARRAGNFKLVKVRGYPVESVYLD